jgi:hypothetical protein
MTSILKFCVCNPIVCSTLSFFPALAGLRAPRTASRFKLRVREVFPEVSNSFLNLLRAVTGIFSTRSAGRSLAGLPLDVGALSLSFPVETSIGFPDSGDEGAESVELSVPSFVCGGEGEASIVIDEGALLEEEDADDDDEGGVEMLEGVVSTVDGVVSSETGTDVAFSSTGVGVDSTEAEKGVIGSTFDVGVESNVGVVIIVS